MASGPTTSWEIDGETVETVSDFIFGAPKSLQMVTAVMKLKDAYSLEGKVMANLGSILKSRDITLPTKVCLVLCLIPGSGRFPGGGHGNPLQYPCLENPHGQRSLAGYSLVVKSQSRLNY